MEHTRRWNIEETEFGLRVCRGEHARGNSCEWEFLYWSDEYLQAKSQIRALEEVNEHLREESKALHRLHGRAVKQRDQLRAQLEAVEGLPEKWRESEQRSIDEENYGCMDVYDCADELGAILK